MNKNRTLIINKQAPACPSTQRDQEGCSSSEVSAWLLRYVHVTCWQQTTNKQNKMWLDLWKLHRRSNVTMGSIPAAHKTLSTDQIFGPLWHLLWAINILPAVDCSSNNHEFHYDTIKELTAGLNKTTPVFNQDATNFHHPNMEIWCCKASLFENRAKRLKFNRFYWQYKLCKSWALLSALLEVCRR